MTDRVPLYPGRVTLTPVSGQENTYDMVRADQPTVEGTPLNKATFLTDTVATQFGLSGDTATVNDVLSILANAALLNSSVATQFGLSGNTATFNDVLSILANAALLNSNESAITNMDGDELLTIPGVRIATGSYTGTGTYGSSNPCRITFDFTPTLVFFIGNRTTVHGYVSNYGYVTPIIYWGVTTTFTYWTGECSITYSGNRISWYSTDSAYYQSNSNNTTYYYFAIG